MNARVPCGAYHIRSLARVVNRAKDESLPRKLSQGFGYLPAILSSRKIGGIAAKPEPGIIKLRRR